MKPNNIKILEKLEKFYNVVDIYKYKTSTAWINIKNYIYSKSLNYDFFIENQKLDKKKALYFVFLSFINLFRQKGDVLFVGAGSGIMQIDEQYIDIYKDAIQEKNIIYFTSIDRLDRMYQAKEFYKKNHIIVHSLLFSVIRNIIAKFMKNRVVLNDDEIIRFLEESNISISNDDIKYIYAKFKAGYHIYKFLFKFYNIKKAYIVSSYSNTEMIAVLKEKNIEVIEIQHGLIGEMHRGYNYKIKSKLLPTPNTIMVYDEFWKQELIDADYYQSEQIKIFEKFQYKKVKNIKIFNKKFIVFTGQGIFKDEIENFFYNSIKFLEENDLYLVYLPHPSENFNFDISSEYIKILNQKEYLTEQYIKSAIAHISIYSSCHFDAIHFHNKTFVFDVMKDNIMDYYKNKYPQNVIYIKNLDEVIK